MIHILRQVGLPHQLNHQILEVILVAVDNAGFLPLSSCDIDLHLVVSARQFDKLVDILQVPATVSPSDKILFLNLAAIHPFPSHVPELFVFDDCRNHPISFLLAEGIEPLELLEIQ